MIEQIVVPQWVSVKAETREKLRGILMIPKTGHCETITNELGVSQVVSDGTTNIDLLSITVEKLIGFLGSAAINETVYDLFKRAVKKIEEPEIEHLLVPPEMIQQVSEITSTIVADSKVVGDVIKCEKCQFETKSKVAMRLHVGKKHK